MKLLFACNVPAPYMDVWFRALEKEFSIEVIYDYLHRPLHPWKNTSWYQGKMFSDYKLKDLYKAVKSSDAVFVCGWNRPHLLLTIVMAVCTKKKLIGFTDHPMHRQFFLSLWIKKLFLFRNYSIYCCATSPTCSLIEKKYSALRGKTLLFPYGVEIPESIQSFDSDSNKIRVLVANSFIPRKGYSVLFKALEELSKTDKKDIFEFRILGKGEEWEKYQQWSKSLNLNISMIGWVDTVEYLDNLNACDVFIHASLAEPYGIPPIEAMLRGKVVVVSDKVMSTKQLVVTGQNGYMYESDNYKALYDILYSLDKTTFQSIGNQAISDSTIFCQMEQYVKALKRRLNEID